ncbi:MAG: CopD family protein [Geodermatophilaceae bacterium]
MFSELFGSGYGLLLLGKVTALAALAGFGWWHRRSTIGQLTAGRPGAFRRFAGREVLVMIGTIALAVALSRAPTPGPARGEPVYDGLAVRDHTTLTAVRAPSGSTATHQAEPTDQGSARHSSGSAVGRWS